MASLLFKLVCDIPIAVTVIFVFGTLLALFLIREAKPKKSIAH